MYFGIHLHFAMHFNEEQLITLFRIELKHYYLRKILCSWICNQYGITLRCVIPVVCITNKREENVVEQHN